MGVGAIAGIAGGLLGAGGDVAGALLSKPKTQKARVSDTGLARDASLQAAEFQNLLALGLVDPSMLVSAGPLARLMAEVSASPLWANDTKGQIVDNIRTAMIYLQRTGRTSIPNDLQVNMDRVLQPLLQAGGYADFNEFLDAEETFQQQVGPLIQRAQKSGLQNFQNRLSQQEQLNQILTNFPGATPADIAALQAQVKQTMLRDLNQNVDEQIGTAIRGANFANYNPGEPVAKLEEFRANATQDADLEALSRAVAIIGGQQGVATNSLNALSAGLGAPLNQAAQLSAINLGSQGGSVYQQPPVPNPVGAGIAQAGSDLGSALAWAGANYQSQQNAALMDARSDFQTKQLVNALQNRT
jgi:hypothetical protein